MLEVCPQSVGRGRAVAQNQKAGTAQGAVQFQRAGRLPAGFPDTAAGSIPGKCRLNPALSHYIENHIANSAFMVVTWHRHDIKLDNGRDLGDFFVSLSVPDTVLMYKVIMKDGTICGGWAVKAYDC